MSYSIFEYKPDREIMNEIKDECDYLCEAIKIHAEVLKQAGVGQAIIKGHHKSRQLLINAADEILLEQCKEFALFIVQSELLDD